MTFLAPTPALVAAAVCVPVLLALYLLRLRRRPVRVGSILFWPKATEDVQANVPLRWLKPTWLLFLHLLALACLLLAFARPAVEGISIAGDRVVVIVDASASMSAVDAGETLSRLERAKVRAKALIRDCRGAGAESVSVVCLSARARPMSGFLTSQTLLNAAVDAVEPTDQAGNLGAALELVEAMGRGEGGAVGEAEETRTTPTVFLVSDGSFGAVEGKSGSGLRVRFERVGAGASGDVDNVGVVRLATKRDEHDAELLRVFAEVLNAGAAPVDVPVTLALDGKSVESRAVRIDGAKKGVPGRATVLFDVRGVTDGVLTLLLARPDAMTSDDTASVVLVKPTAPRILLVREVQGAATGEGAGPGDALPAPTWLLGDVLEELHPRELVRMGAAEYEAMVRAGGERAFDLVVFDRVRPLVTPAIPNLSLGAVPEFAGVTVVSGLNKVRPGSVFWDRSHPLMRGVPLDTLVVREAMGVRIGAAVLGGGSGDAAPVVLVRADDDPLVFMVEKAGVRHVVVGFDLAQSNWALTPSFAVFLANTVDELTLRARSADGRAFRADEPVLLLAPPRGEVVLEGPQRIVVREAGTGSGAAAAGSGNESVELNAGVVPRAGVYVVRASEATGNTPAGAGAGAAVGVVQRAVAVNVFDSVESTLASPASVLVGGQEVGSVQPTRVPREIWHWFVVGALALLAVEWLVYARQVRA